MRTSGRKFAQELTGAGITVGYFVLPGAFHAFLERPHEPSFTEGLDLIV